MKRHEGLAPLSREHHDGLLLAVRLQQGTSALLRLWSHDTAWQARYVTRFFDEHLAVHFSTEEEHLFPACAALPGLGDVVAELVREHEEMRSLAAGLRAPQDEAKRAASLLQFGTVLERHIRTEERVLFPRCEELLAPADLERIARAIGHTHGGAS